MFFWKRKRKNQQSNANHEYLSKDLRKNIAHFKCTLFKDDEAIVYREFQTQGPDVRDCVIICADNMINHEFISEFVLRPLMLHAIPKKLAGDPLIEHIESKIIHSDRIEIYNKYNDLADALYNGASIILINGCNKAITVEAEGWKTRGISEPISETVIRGPRQGFVEELAVNVALIRRKFKSTDFKVKFLNVGTQTRTRVAVVYLESVASNELVQEVIRRINLIEIDGVLESGYIEEFIQDSPSTLLPTIGNTERPDVVAGRILEGRVAVLVDGTPFALTMPYLFLEAFQANEDYYNHWIPASFHRILRYICFAITTITPALYFSLSSYDPQLLPTRLVLAIAASRKMVPFPALVEILAMGLVFEILREGGLRLPQPVGEAMSIVGAIVLGDAAVSANLVSAPMIVVVAITGVSGFVISDLYDTAVIVRLILVLVASIFGLYGVLLGTMSMVLQLSSMHSFGVPYLSSLTSFAPQSMKDTVIRVPWQFMRLRPRYIAFKNRKRLQKGPGGKKS